MSTDQEPSDERLSAAYRKQRLRSPKALDERVLELAQERAPESRGRGWNWSPAWSGVAVVCVLALWLPALIESPTPIINSSNFDDNVSVPESANLADSPVESLAAARVSAARLKSSADAPSASARAELHSDQASAGVVSVEVIPARAAEIRPSVATETAAAPMRMAVDEPTHALSEGRTDAGAAVYADSEAWLQSIAEMAENDDMEAAQAAFEAFRQAYPEVEVEATLLERLRLYP